ncbi:MAG: 3-hydroxyacyl-ACP dehydratase [Ferruginibacter sp.]
MNLPTKNIELLIPQREPFVMIDELLSFDDQTTRSSFLIKKDNIFVENERFGEPGLLENIAQTAAARAGYISRISNQLVEIGYIGAVKNLVIHSLPSVHDKLVTEITVNNQVFEVNNNHG